MQFINVHDVTLLLNGSDDGTVRLWSNYMPRDNKDPELVAAWQALPDVTPSNRSINGKFFLLQNPTLKFKFKIFLFLVNIKSFTKISIFFPPQVVLVLSWFGSREHSS